MTRFTPEDAVRAYEDWGCNCGPSALAAIAGLTLDEVRPHMGDFESKGYTNPTLMFFALESVGRMVRIRSIARNVAHLEWPHYGLARIQWEGPWTRAGVPVRARYRHTHWVGAARRNGEVGIYDINAMGNGSGWCRLSDWEQVIVPHILAECVPRASGGWHITHTIEVERPEASAIRRAAGIPAGGDEG